MNRLLQKAAQAERIRRDRQRQREADEVESIRRLAYARGAQQAMEERHKIAIPQGLEDVILEEMSIMLARAVFDENKSHNGRIIPLISEIARSTVEKDGWPYDLKAYSHYLTDRHELQFVLEAHPKTVKWRENVREIQQRIADDERRNGTNPTQQ